jgi:adenylate cyclase
LERKLTAILCADVFGYSRLMGENEEATLRTLSSHRKQIDSLIEQHHGRFVNSAGDSVLAEFASVVNAVQCAVEIQATLKSENEKLPPQRRMEFRIGVNLGDVMVDGAQIYGDGVNVAARLESLAEPGGICVSGIVHDQVRDKLTLSYEDAGEREVKNIARPVRVYRVLTEPGADARPSRRTQRVPRKYMRRGIFSMIGLTLIAAVIVFVQHLSLRPPSTTASIPPAQSPALTLPAKPSIAVLPFTNMSGDPQQEYFTDGITDDLITDLSRGPDIFVIARTSTFTYKGKPVKVQEVGRELGVKYVLEGSVRKAGDEVRIDAQLVDATTGADLWAERYDRPLRNIFSLQDEIVRRIVTTLNLQLTLWEDHGILVRKRTDNLEAYDDFLRGAEYQSSLSKEGNAKARQMFEKAIELDPKYVDAYVSLGWCYWVAWALQWSPAPGTLDRAFELAHEAITLNDSAPMAHALLGRLLVGKRQYDQAVTESEQAIALGPNFAFDYGVVADSLNLAGKYEEAIQDAEKAMRLDPRNRDGYLFEIAFAYTFTGRYEAAVPVLKRHLVRYPNHLGAHLVLAVAYSELGLKEQSQAEAADVMRINPQFSLALHKQMLPIREPLLRDRVDADLRQAGLK